MIVSASHMKSPLGMVHMVIAWYGWYFLLLISFYFFHSYFPSMLCFCSHISYSHPSAIYFILVIHQCIIFNTIRFLSKLNVNFKISCHKLYRFAILLYVYIESLLCSLHLFLNMEVTNKNSCCFQLFVLVGCWCRYCSFRVEKWIGTSVSY